MILVVGAAGLLGGATVTGLLARDLPVRSLVHLAAPPPGSDEVHGDLLDPPSLRPALHGVETVLVTATAMARRLAGPGPSIAAVDRDGVGALVDAAERAGVRRFVYVSCAGVDQGAGSPLERAKLAVEARLGRSAMRTVIVRPDAYQEINLAPIGRFDLVRRRVSIVGRGENPRRWVGIADVAALLVALTTEAEPPPVVEFGGPQALSRNAAVLKAEITVRRRLRVQRLPRWAARLGMRALEPRNDALASVLGLGLALDLVPAGWDDRPLLDRGILARPATAFLDQQARAVLAAPGR